MFFSSFLVVTMTETSIVFLEDIEDLRRPQKAQEGRRGLKRANRA
jgi:hypothetical protein